MPTDTLLQLAAPLAAGLNYLEVIKHSGPIGIFVLLLLLGASVASWAIIALKYFHLRQAQKQSVEFLDIFWQSKRLDAIYQAAEKLSASPISQVFRAGYIELSKVTAGAPEGAERQDLDGIENIERALRRASVAELTYLESKVAFLATTGTTAPFVGLFGTVWGIMGAFQDIYLQGNANLATVAKPISEALIATAVGLFAAIPAVVAYNFFLSKIKVLESEMESFSSDFLNIVKRHFFK
ncbi:MAG: protein TolQ [Myxococcales bacterium]|jgi:biopolymer transport protein TolQ